MTVDSAPRTRGRFGARSDWQLERHLAAIAQHLDRRHRTNPGVGDQAEELRRIVNRLAVELDDDVSGAQSGFETFRIPRHPRYQCAVRVRRPELAGGLFRQLLDAEEAHGTTPHFAELLQIVDDLARQVARDGKPDPLVPAALGEDAGVDTNQFAAAADQRSARVAGVDRRVRLNEVFVISEPDVRPSGGADDTGRHRLTELERAANRQHRFTDPE